MCFGAYWLLLLGWSFPNALACPCVPESLCKVDSLPSKEVVAFWVVKPNDTQWKNMLDLTNLTTTVAVFAGADGVPADLVCYAHRKGVRVVRGVDFDKAQLTNESARAQFVSGTVQAALDQGYDGVNLDIEGNTVRMR